jgi:protein-tyrosine phosphatase
VRLLFVCTGNLCRSPVAERLMAAHARRSPDRTAVLVRSAGLAATAGRPMHPLSASALTALGGDPAGFSSSPFQPELAAAADLVLTMTRSQRRKVLEHTPRGLRRTFTLLEAADLLDRADLTALPEISVAERAAVLARRLDAARAQRTTSAADDIPDPIGGDAAAHRTAAESIAQALRPLAAVLLPSAAEPDRSGTVPAPAAAHV